MTCSWENAGHACEQISKVCKKWIENWNDKWQLLNPLSWKVSHFIPNFIILCPQPIPCFLNVFQVGLIFKYILQPGYCYNQALITWCWIKRTVCTLRDDICRPWSTFVYASRNVFIRQENKPSVYSCFSLSWPRLLWPCFWSWFVWKTALHCLHPCSQYVT